MKVKTQLLYFTGLILNIIFSEASESEDSDEDNRAILPRGAISHIVGTVIDAVANPIKDVADIIDTHIRPIIPGTLWCGDGNVARNLDDLGLFRSTDNCCREHDICKDNIAGGGSKHGLKNTGFFTKSHCDCDDSFYNCLKQAANIISWKVGIKYFNILHPQCFKEEFPITGCSKYAGILPMRCIEYTTDTSSPKIWQWFDSKEF